jgi:CheY-like chemotaxis protein
MTARAMKGDRERCLEAGMDGYLAKPIQPAELFAVIEELVPGVGAAVDPGAQVLNRPEALARVQGDRVLLRELVELFLAGCDEQLARLRAATEAGDLETVRTLSHALKSAVGTFGAKEAYEAALRLEVIGRSGDLLEARTAFADLAAAVGRLKPALAQLATT